MKLNIDQVNLMAVLPTTILPLDGTYKVETASAIDITGIPHYIGHPATAKIVESFGAIAASSKLFKGLQIGERAVCFAIAQGKSDRSQGGTAVNQQVSFEDLVIRIIERIA